MVASAHLNGSVNIWAENSPLPAQEIQVSDSAISSVRFAPDDKYIYTTGRDHRIRQFDIRTWKEVWEAEHDLYRCGSNYQRLCVSADAKFVVAGSKSGAVCVFKSADGDIEEIFEEKHKTCVNVAEWQPRGNKFVTADSIGSMCLWKP